MSFTDLALANAEVTRLSNEVSRISTERNRLAGDVATAQAERATATARASELEAEHKATWRESQPGWGDLIFAIIGIVLAVALLYWDIRSISTDFASITWSRLAHLMMGPLVGLLVFLLGATLCRMLNGMAAELAGIVGCGLGVAIFIFMYQAMHAELITVPLHPVTEQHYGDEHYDVLCIEKLDLPKEFETVDVIVQVRHTLTKDDAIKISAKAPWPVKVPKGAEGNVFSQANTQAVPSRSSSYWGLDDPKPAKTTPDTTSGE